jgi:hypothetical protein
MRRCQTQAGQKRRRLTDDVKGAVVVTFVQVVCTVTFNALTALALAWIR